MFLISLDELERVKRANQLRSAVDLAAKTGLSRNTWNKAIKTQRPTPQVLDALADLGARPDRVLVKLTDADLTVAA
ncbi:XRE family transcriptional regulator [Corynebacterium sp. AOP40-9SA-29]|uniref:XRE family transcriptional regulator n=1 Tax=Corynebacterium sp. AOP40-9SA-29 TaxID=3457677 RepID=UPI0040346246